MKKILALILLLTIIPTSRIKADSFFRCGKELVTIGNSGIRVLINCGPPSYKIITNPGIEGPLVEKWYYNCGERRFMYSLRFIDGILDNIKNEGYGEGSSDCRGAETK